MPIQHDARSDICARSLSMLPRNQAQIILFSATFPDHVRNFANKFAPNANKIELKKNELSVDNIRQFYMDCKNEEHKYDVLVSLYHLLTIGQSIIFCQVSSIRECTSIIRLIIGSWHSAPTHGRPDISAHDSRRPQGCVVAWSEGCCRA